MFLTNWSYGGKMAHLYGLMRVLTAGGVALDSAEAAENGLDMRARTRGYP